MKMMNYYIPFLNYFFYESKYQDTKQFVTELFGIIMKYSGLVLSSIKKIVKVSEEPSKKEIKEKIKIFRKFIVNVLSLIANGIRLNKLDFPEARASRK